ncbi:cytochrome o ubiquinol oxidase subunit IV [Cupriavidus plantarum]|uniref:Cytochrome bo(3) ubiquinol oxidase subunit 4 n=1 Tax=Cupriavidus plantarum TaxID=942865 RepID=A0A316FK54_9BURK|nr:cytochrome o ubiquinol oxidase subunit IV [Cupriavidus plantarum]NYH98370.1 cytochrome o ubiquinol oxidase operon protein cyoD [Cupriavidus plantarum]PWK38000.1 cytochrome bo3 quinol oxidase subunit 4 [Cupriavidus plantarum]REF01301.1 cytochrome bo3 quinol oxidase subunit 4 [Cupriavidus plantarum]RLK45840.1 cytochrome bo3 quinol oxidase subunit 4 [Cupriavidus plantarum]CAG2127807.1 Cytochrome bo(3) ubiquinol oxidase subunit 4 [Cupriavidus plantarum]
MAQHQSSHGAHGASHDAPHGAAHGHASVKSYVIGFVLAVILTVIPFKIVMDGTMDRGTILWIILGMGVVQIIVHLKYFLHLDSSNEQRGNVIAFLFTVLILFIVLAGSLWIMHNMNANMMPMAH